MEPRKPHWHDPTFAWRAAYRPALIRTRHLARPAPMLVQRLQNVLTSTFWPYAVEATVMASAAQAFRLPARTIRGRCPPETL